MTLFFHWKCLPGSLPGANSTRLFPNLFFQLFPKPKHICTHKDRHIRLYIWSQQRSRVSLKSGWRSAIATWKTLVTSPGSYQPSHFTEESEAQEGSLTPRRSHSQSSSGGQVLFSPSVSWWASLGILRNIIPALGPGGQRVLCSLVG